jgi:DNA-binding phage protein
VNSTDIEAAIKQHLPRIDDNFMAVLTANIKAAEEKGDIAASARLKQVSETVMRILRENAPPELRFVSDLLAEESPDVARALVEEKAAEIGPPLLALMDRLAGDLLAQGDQARAQHLLALREHAAQTIGEPGD